MAQDGVRKAVRFGKLKAKQADSVLLYMEDLIYAQVSGRSPNSSTSQWIAGLPDGIRKRIERVRLIEPAERKECPTLDEWVGGYIKQRSDVKPATVIKFNATHKKLVAFFGKSKNLVEINPSDAEDFVVYLKQKGLSEATTRRLSGIAKQFFRKAYRSKLITENPFDDIKCASFTDPTRRYFISPTESQSILNECPDREWRLIFALCRYGALRCPSEVLRLTWADIDWAKDRFTVHADKTAHHESGGVRIVPIFPELLPYLQDCFDHAEPGSEFVITRYRDPKQNLRTQFQRIIIKAGLKPWPKLFVNLRSTRVTELNEIFPSHVVAAWAGHSEAIERKHYLQVTENHFQKAAQNPAQYTSESDCTGLDEKVKNVISDSAQAFANSCNDQELETMGVIRLELMTSSTSRMRSSQLS